MYNVSATGFPWHSLVQVTRRSISHKWKESSLQLWKFFANSPKLTAVLVKAQESWRKIKLSHKARSAVEKKVRKACRTRWLSTSNAVDGVYEDFFPIIQAINLIDDKDALASYLLSKMKSFKFVGTIYILFSQNKQHWVRHSSEVPLTLAILFLQSITQQTN
mgnify:CR=1 FL=1